MSDRVFTRDGNCYTSAGAASAIDLAVELVTEDLGHAAGHEIAKRMVLFLRRSGAEPQISKTLHAQGSASQAMRDLLVWMAENVMGDLSVARLARQIAMSQRNFARHFAREVHQTPARYLTNLRLEVAKSYLERDSFRMKEVAKASGFQSAEVLRRAFVKSYGMSPQQYRNAAMKTPGDSGSCTPQVVNAGASCCQRIS